MKLFKLCNLFFLFALLSPSAFPNDNITVQLAQLTSQYYSYLSNSQFDAIYDLVDDNFSFDNLINFNSRRETLKFLQDTFSPTTYRVELLLVNVWSYEELDQISKFPSHKRLKSYLDKMNTGDWITLVPKVRINQRIFEANLILVFNFKNNRWLIKGMYELE